ncbi:TonB-dependent receptor, partial [Brevundimonas denitrificans]|uniref:TonB-dependent receptor n=1 Tax=Brevundimonas denitrificans TaxID=1443434 RepID=UPI0024E0E06E
MLLVTTALSGLMAGMIQTAPTPPPQQPPQTPATPAPAAEPASDAYELDSVVTTGARPRGSVNSDIPPDVTLSAEQIAAYGASNIAELLTYLEPLTRSSRGRADGMPVFLVNGRRISGFREIQGLPPEAIERMDILPEEVALEYGYAADQRVVNFVLKANFRSLTGEVSGRMPTQGGRTTTEIEGNALHISGPIRWSVDAEYERSSPLYESERDIERDAGTTPFDDVDAFRTLLGQSERSTVRGTFKRDLNNTTQATLSGSLEDRSSLSFNGLPGVILSVPAGNPYSTSPTPTPVSRVLDALPLNRETDSLTGGLGLVVDGFLGDDWRWTLTGNYDRIETDTLSGRGFDTAGPFQTRLNANDPTANPYGMLSANDFVRLSDDTANSVSQVLSTELVLNGDVFELPAGGISSTFRIGADTRSLDSTSVRSGLTTERSQSRDRLNSQASFSIPIASRRRDVLPAIGDLSANFNVGYEELSDFGGLTTLGFGVNWSPIEPLSFQLSYTDEHGAPSISQLNDPTVSTFNVPVFDFATNQTVLVTRIDGGNPNLNSDNRQVWKAGFNLKPWSETDFRVSSTWTYSLTEDAIAAFPTLTPDLEAALPGRFNRVGGVLVSFDARPLNFERFERQDIRTGFNYSRAFGAPNPAAAPLPGAPGSARPPMGGGMPMRVEVRTEGG